MQPVTTLMKKEKRKKISAANLCRSLSLSPSLSLSLTNTHTHILIGEKKKSLYSNTVQTQYSSTCNQIKTFLKKQTKNKEKQNKKN